MLLLLIATIAMMTTTTTTMTTAAYGQETVFLREPNEHTDRLIAEVMSDLQNMTQDHSMFYGINLDDDGDMNLWFNNGTENDFEDDMYIATQHSYTPENGYEFRGQEIIAPNGTALFG
jgi:hypothetical protein